jgi:hypothetical protein
MSSRSSCWDRRVSPVCGPDFFQSLKSEEGVLCDSPIKFSRLLALLILLRECKGSRFVFDIKIAGSVTSIFSTT